jgi:hypothetical protein
MIDKKPLQFSLKKTVNVPKIVKEKPKLLDLVLSVTDGKIESFEFFIFFIFLVLIRSFKNHLQFLFSQIHLVVHYKNPEKMNLLIIKRKKKIQIMKMKKMIKLMILKFQK